MQFRVCNQRTVFKFYFSRGSILCPTWEQTFQQDPLRGWGREDDVACCQKKASKNPLSSCTHLDAYLGMLKVALKPGNKCSGSSLNRNTGESVMSFGAADTLQSGGTLETLRFHPGVPCCLLVQGSMWRAHASALVNPWVQNNLLGDYSLISTAVKYLVLRSTVLPCTPGTFTSMALFVFQVPFCWNGNVRGTFQIPYFVPSFSPSDSLWSSNQKQCSLPSFPRPFILFFPPSLPYISWDRELLRLWVTVLPRYLEPLSSNIPDDANTWRHLCPFYKITLLHVIIIFPCILNNFKTIHNA